MWQREKRSKCPVGQAWRQILPATVITSIGLVAIYCIDIADMFFLSLLGDDAVTAAIGFAASILFMVSAGSIACGIATGARVAQTLGCRPDAAAAAVTARCLFLTAIGMGVAAILLAWFAEDLLRGVGASGRALSLGTAYLQTSAIAVPVQALCMSSLAALRAFHWYRHTLVALLMGGVVNVLLDPLFIFVFDGGIVGAAHASNIARGLQLLVALVPFYQRHASSMTLDLQGIVPELKSFFLVAGPATLNNLVSPLGSLYVIREAAVYGPLAVIGVAVVARIVPFVFVPNIAACTVTAPLIGRHHGGGQIKSIQAAVAATLRLQILWTLMATAVLMVSAGAVADLFSAEGLAKDLIILFCSGLCGAQLFESIGGMATLACNNMGHSRLAGAVAVLQLLILHIPLVWLCSLLLDASGVLVGQSLALICYGLMAWLAFRWVLSQTFRNAARDGQNGSAVVNSSSPFSGVTT